jgi:hypothetical protein
LCYEEASSSPGTQNRHRSSDHAAETCNAFAKPFILKSISGVAFGRRVLEQVTPTFVFMEGAEITDCGRPVHCRMRFQADL